MVRLPAFISETRMPGKLLDTFPRLPIYFTDRDWPRMMSSNLVILPLHYSHFEELKRVDIIERFSRLHDMGNHINKRKLAMIK